MRKAIVLSSLWLFSCAEQGIEGAHRHSHMGEVNGKMQSHIPDGFIPGLGAAEDLMTAAFTLQEGESSSEIFDLAGLKVLVQVIERTTPDADEIAARRDDNREAALVQKQNGIVEAWLADYRRQLEEAGRLKVNAAMALGS